METLNFLLIEKLNKLVYLSPGLTDLVAWIADKLDVWVIVLLVAWFMRRAWQSHRASHRLFGFRSLHSMIMTVITGVGAWLVSHAAKAIFVTPRPFLVEGLEVVPVFLYGGFNSFPSGHAAMFMALGLMTWFHDRTAGVVVLVCALLIGIGRIMVGIHFPIDILAGYMIGAIFVLIVMLFDRKHLVLHTQ